MSDSIWTGTLAAFRDRLAGLEPAPAAVSAAAVTATLGFGLLIKVLEIASKRKDFAGDRERVTQLVHEARNKSQILTHFADADIAAVREYVHSVRQQELTSEVLRKAIDIPLGVARACSSGLALCEKARPLVHAFIAPDLSAAAALLAGSFHASMASVDFNVQQLPEGDSYREEVTEEAGRLRQNISAHGWDHL